MSLAARIRLYRQILIRCEHDIMEDDEEQALHRLQYIRNDLINLLSKYEEKELGTDTRLTGGIRSNGYFSK